MIMLSILFAAILLFADSTQQSLLQDSLPYPAILTDMTNVTVVHITILMQEKIVGVERAVVEMTGYRIQIFASNVPGKAKNEALLLEQKMKGLIDVPIYVISEPPFMKVRLGDFRTREEAATFKDHFIETFPDMIGDTYIVRDTHIQVAR